MHSIFLYDLQENNKLSGQKELMTKQGGSIRWSFGGINTIIKYYL